MNNPFIGNKLEKEMNVLLLPHYLETIVLKAIDGTRGVDPQGVAHLHCRG